MDLSDMSKAATRKRVNTDAEMLREKMSRESSRIITLKVAQDYWDLKERLSGVEAEHERLQQNKQDAQMQHETLSAQYQDELRLRPETLNKLGSTHEMCNVLQDYTSRVRESLRRAAADRATLDVTTLGSTHEMCNVLQDYTSRVRESLRRAAADRATLDVTTLGSTHEMCNVLQDYTSRVRESLRRAAADRATLDVSYAGAARQVHHEHSQHARNLEHANVQVNVLGDKLNLSTEHNAQLAQLAADAQRQAEARETEARAQLSAAAELHDLLQVKHQQEKAALTNAALIDRDRSIAELKQEIERRAAESETAETLRAKLQKEVETLSASLAASEARGEAVTKECSRLLDSLATAEEKVARLSEETVKLKSIVQGKEKELAAQVIRNEKERLQDVIRGMLCTIDNIQKELTLRPPPTAARAAAASAAHSAAHSAAAFAARREPPGHENNAKDAAPTPIQGVCSKPSKSDRAIFLSPRASPDVDSLIYNFLSDSSSDGDMIDPAKLNAAPPPTSLRALKRRRSGSRASADDELSMSQVKADLTNCGRRFFRTKRLDAKPKKA